MIICVVIFNKSRSVNLMKNVNSRSHSLNCLSDAHVNWLCPLFSTHTTSNLKGKGRRKISEEKKKQTYNECGHVISFQRKFEEKECSSLLRGGGYFQFPERGKSIPHSNQSCPIERLTFLMCIASNKCRLNIEIWHCLMGTKYLIIESDTKREK